MPTPRTTAAVLLVFVMAIWGSTFVVTKNGLAEIPPLQFALLRFLAALLLLAPVALWRGGLARLPRPRPWGTIAVMALTGVGLYYVGFNLSLVYTNASQGALVQSSVPAVTALLAALWLGERVSRQRAVGIGLAVLGVVVIFARTAPDATAPAPLLGNALMFGCVLVWAVYTVLAKRLAHTDPVVVTACVFLFGTLMLVPPALIEARTQPLPSISAAGWAAILYLGVLASAAGFLFYNRALRTLDASQVGTFVNLVPLIGVISGILFLNESLTLFAIVGGALVLIGVWISSR